MTETVHLASSCLIVLTSHNFLSEEQAHAVTTLFQKALEQKHGRLVRVTFIQLDEPASVRGNLIGYLRTHREALQRHMLDAVDCVIYVHDAGQATRMFPLSYEHGNASKAAIRFPTGSALEMLLICIAKSIPLLKECAMIFPVDQYFCYDTLDVDSLQRSIARHCLTLVAMQVPVERALGSLGVLNLNSDGRVSFFREKTNDRSLIPEHVPNHTLASTFQVFSSIEALTHLTTVIEKFIADQQNAAIVQDLNESGWSFSSLIFETLCLPKHELSAAQAALHPHLSQAEFCFGGVVAEGEWEDWAQSGKSYMRILRSLAILANECDDRGNYMIRSQNIRCTGRMVSCIFIDCETVDLLGDFENCVFVNCSRIRLMNCENASGSLFYALKEVNFFRRDMTQYLYGRFLSGQRHFEFECEIDARTDALFKIMDRIIKSWERMPR